MNLTTPIILGRSTPQPRHSIRPGRAVAYMHEFVHFEFERQVLPMSCKNACMAAVPACFGSRGGLLLPSVPGLTIG